jgi:hypothetical protein
VATKRQKTAARKNVGLVTGRVWNQTGATGNVLRVGGASVRGGAGAQEAPFSSRAQRGTY